MLEFMGLMIFGLIAIFFLSIASMLIRVFIRGKKNNDIGPKNIFALVFGIVFFIIFIVTTLIFIANIL